MWSPVPTLPSRADPTPVFTGAGIHYSPSRPNPSFPHPFPLFPRRACPREHEGQESIPSPSLSSRMRGPIPFPFAPLPHPCSVGAVRHWVGRSNQFYFHSLSWPLLGKCDSGPSEELPYPLVPFSIQATLVVAPLVTAPYINLLILWSCSVPY